MSFLSTSNTASPISRSVNGRPSLPFLSPWRTRTWIECPGNWGSCRTAWSETRTSSIPLASRATRTSNRMDAFSPMDAPTSNARSSPFASVASDPKETPWPSESLKYTGPAGVPLTTCLCRYVPCSRCSMTEIEGTGDGAVGTGGGSTGKFWASGSSAVHHGQRAGFFALTTCCST